MTAAQVIVARLLTSDPQRNCMNRYRVTIFGISITGLEILFFYRHIFRCYSFNDFNGLQICFKLISKVRRFSIQLYMFFYLKSFITSSIENQFWFDLILLIFRKVFITLIPHQLCFDRKFSLLPDSCSFTRIQ